MQPISFQALPVLIDGHDTQGQLVAVLARLDGDMHDPAMKGWWNLEAGFGPCQAVGDTLSKTLHEAEAWVRQRIAAEGLARVQSLKLVK